MTTEPDQSRYCERFPHGGYHASKHFDAVEAAESLLAALKEAGR